MATSTAATPAAATPVSAPAPVSQDKENTPKAGNKPAAAGATPAPAAAATAAGTGATALTPDPTDMSIKHPLHNTWTMWYDKHDKKHAQQNYASHIKSVNTFSSVEDFWRLFNNVMPPSRLMIGADYAVFKQGIKPMWEDPANERGGKWVLQVPRSNRKNLDQLWLHVLLSLIGELFDEGDDICGVVISVRRTQDKLAVWTKSATNETIVRSIGQQYKEFLNLPPGLKLTYSFHNESLKRGSSFNVKNAYEL